KIVVQVRARGDDEIHQPPVHQLDDTAPKAGRRHGACHGQPDRGVVGWREHLGGEDLARLRQASRVEGLKPLVYQVADLRAATRTVVVNRLAREELTLGVPGRTGSAMRQGWLLWRVRGMGYGTVTPSPRKIA